MIRGMARCGLNWRCGSGISSEHGPESCQQKVGAYELDVLIVDLFLLKLRHREIIVITQVEGCGLNDREFVT